MTTRPAEASRRMTLNRLYRHRGNAQWPLIASRHISNQKYVIIGPIVSNETKTTRCEILFCEFYEHSGSFAHDYYYYCYCVLVAFGVNVKYSHMCLIFLW